MTTKVDLSQNVFTKGIYHGRDEDYWRRRVEDFDLTDTEQVARLRAVCIMRFTSDLNEYEEVAKNENESYRALTAEGKNRLIELAMEGFTNVLEWWAKEPKLVRAYQDEIAEENGREKLTDAEWEAWKLDHAYKDDTLNFMLRVLKNNYAHFSIDEVEQYLEA